MGRPDTPEAARDALRAVGLRATDQRVEVLVAVTAARGDVTAQSLHASMVAAGGRLGLATVYRTLGSLAEAGLVDAMQHGHGTCYRACAPGHHHHLTCDSCHAVIELHECEVGDWASSVAQRHGFSEVRHVLELHGTCAACRAA
jgi:Fur family ferric uptake transcriptional regulator